MSVRVPLPDLGELLPVYEESEKQLIHVIIVVVVDVADPL